MNTEPNRIHPLVAVSKGEDGIRIMLKTSEDAYSFLLYELIRALFFLFFAGRKFRSVSLIMNGKYLSAHCKYSEYLYLWQYVVVSVMPVVLLGLFPTCYGLMFEKYLLLPVGIVFLLMGIPDYKVLSLLRYFSAGDKVINCL